MASILLFLPRLFQFFGVFRNVVGFVGPFWPHLSRMFSRRASA